MLVDGDKISTHDVENDLDGADSKTKLWPVDLMMVLQIMHSKVAHRSIPTIGFIADMIANDVAFAGTCDPAVFARILSKAGTGKVAA